jgi:hypothetical protein
LLIYTGVENNGYITGLFMLWLADYFARPV